MSIRTIILTLLAVFPLGSHWAPTVSAQSPYETGYLPSGTSGFRGFYGGYHASTATEGFLIGQAELLRGRGLASLYYGQALRQREAARKQYFENRLAKLRYYAERQKVRAQRNQLRREEVTRRREIRQRLTAKGKANNRKPIDWPATLTADRFAPIRTEIESLAELRLQLGTDAGEATTAAVRHGIRKLAKTIVEDEQAGRLNEEQAKVVRRFVRELAKNILQTTPPRGERGGETGAVVQWSLGKNFPHHDGTNKLSIGGTPLLLEGAP